MAILLSLLGSPDLFYAFLAFYSANSSAIPRPEWPQPMGLGRKSLLRAQKTPQEPLVGPQGPHCPWWSPITQSPTQLAPSSSISTQAQLPSTFHLLTSSHLTTFSSISTLAEASTRPVFVGFRSTQGPGSPAAGRGLCEEDAAEN